MIPTRNEAYYVELLKRLSLSTISLRVFFERHRFRRFYSCSFFDLSHSLRMCRYKCQASRVLEFLISRSLLDSKWNAALDKWQCDIESIQLRVLNEALSVEARDFVRGKNSSNQKISLSDVEAILEMLMNGPDGRFRRWWIFGSYTSPLIQELVAMKTFYLSRNLEQAEICKNLRAHVLELRDLQRDQTDKHTLLVEVGERLRANQESKNCDLVKYSNLQTIYGLSDVSKVTKEDVQNKILAYLDLRRSEKHKQLREMLRNPPLHIFVHDYNTQYERHLKLEDDTNDLSLTVQELLYYARVTEKVGMIDLLEFLGSMIDDPDQNTLDSVVGEVWTLRDRIMHNKTAARLADSESKLRACIAENERRIVELRQLVRDMAQIAQNSIEKIFQGVEILVD